MPINQHLPAWLKKPYRGVQTFLQNVRDSFRFSLRKTHKAVQELQSTRQLNDELLIEAILYELPNSGVKRPKIKTADETINELINSDKNIVRYGDGEIMVLDGGGIPFQKADKELTRRLRDIFSNKQENLLVALSASYYKPCIFGEKNPMYKAFAMYSLPKCRKMLEPFIDYERWYWEMGINGKTYFDIWRNFFAGKKLVLVGCKEAFESYEFNIFDTASELCYEFVPNKHAFSEYESILSRLMGYDKTYTHILMCGPTANVLVADLTKAGYRALDLGHLAKSYDWHKKGIDMSKSGDNVVKFFDPDE